MSYAQLFTRVIHSEIAGHQEKPETKLKRPLNSAPVTIALQEIRETRVILERLVISSESFDYPAAKEALIKLQRKIRDLSKLEQKLVVSTSPQPVAEILQFPANQV